MTGAASQWSSQDSSLSGDYGSIFILLVLYILQGIPLGLGSSIPLILQNYNVTYSQQAIFSLYTWPFSLKLLWAPLVDALYFRKFGRRKSWLIPTQYLIGIVLLLLSFNIDNLLGPLPKVQVYQGSQNSTILPINSDQISMRKPSVTILAAIFILLDFLCATQDIAVDGWVLTILSKKNIVYGPTCNKVGQTIGITLGYTVFLALQSPDLSNKYFRSVPSDTGIVTLSGFILFWSIIFLVTNTLVLIFKKEKSEKSEPSERKTVFGTYFMLIKIIKLKYIQLLLFILLTYQIGFAITNSATSLKLVEAGISKETLAFLDLPLIPMHLILPWYLSKYSKGPKPLNIFIKAYLAKIICGMFYALLLLWTKQVYDPITDSFPWYYYLVSILVSMLYQAAVDIIFVALLAFVTRISDPTIGGTYMTLLTTITNLGGTWPSSVSLWLLDYLTFKHCSVGGLSCDKVETVATCKSLGGLCNTTIDGYYVELIILSVFGLIWLYWARKRIQIIQSLPEDNWKCS